MKKFLLLLFLALGLNNWALAEEGYHITAKLDGFQEKELYLAYYLLDKQYILDTAQVDNKGTFTFTGEEMLSGGIYLIVLPPDNQFFQILINGEEHEFSLHVKDVLNPSEEIEFKGSPENVLFYEYINYLGKNRPEATRLQEQINAKEEGSAERQELEKELAELNAKIQKYQENIIARQPASLTAAIIKANLPFDMPEFEGTSEEVQLQKWQYTKQHYFDNLDLADPRMLRTPFLYQRVKYYIENLTVQHPDSLSQSLFRVLEAAKPAEETFKFLLIHYLNEYAKSKIVGFDAVYVFLAETYYATGQAAWTEQEQLEKIVDNAQRLKPLLIGKTAPNIKMQTQEGKDIWLHDFQSPYTVLFFWDPDCGHCKKSMPDMVEFYKQFKDRGVEIFAVCTKLYDEMDSCWEYIREKEIGIWLNTVDPYHRSRYKTVYDIHSTPQIYVLDKNKVILSKRIGAEQLPEVMEKILEMDKGK